MPGPAAGEGPLSQGRDRGGRDRAALSVFVGDRPGAAWFHRGEPMVLFDFTVVDGFVRRITFRSEPDVLAQVARRDGQNRRG